MVLSRRVARFNRRATNRVLGHVAPWLPGFGVLTHVGRRSGHRYRTPLNVFRTPDGYVVALTYGPDADWVKNVLAAGECELTTRGRTVRLRDPRVVHDESRRPMPLVVRQVLRLIDASHFLYLTEAD
ncbi:nitroreductase family deazaflavin-dependent oxidoreductase [Thermasporomyces composti]|uniref:Deazaflavin-dependent oxidoreductase (Nitroreductase family) n=1 Tax=Thermasporomyces composti TaxID=696763 RepID=A0A3D9V663_THECX|nr:nitroreductase family deazaflavin-dependent oxidoreductase [Thermasporomyces composti]REF36183.1 deazaflavin-dependent oxidoreductase (nitroreductase family) [Thermasporomyces composti]